MDIDCAIPREFLHRGVVLLVRFRKDGPPGSDLKGQYIGNYTTGFSFSQNPLCRTFQSAWLALQPEKDDNTTWILMKSSHDDENWEIVHYEYARNQGSSELGSYKIRSAQYPAKLSSHGPLSHSKRYPPPEGESWAILTNEPSNLEYNTDLGNVWELIAINRNYQTTTPSNTEF